MSTIQQHLQEQRQAAENFNANEYISSLTSFQLSSYTKGKLNQWYLDNHITPVKYLEALAIRKERIDADEAKAQAALPWFLKKQAV